jgi:ribonucleotide monophosphatase NagD (HAD superfamily)
VGAIKGCTGKEPTIVGKSSYLMIDYLEKKKYGMDRSRICMVVIDLIQVSCLGRTMGSRVSWC